MPGKVKVSVTVATDLMEKVERARRRTPGATRSSIVEAWLRRGSRASAEDELREATIRYYESLSGPEVTEGQALSKALSRTARRLDIDGSERRRSRR